MNNILAKTANGIKFKTNGITATANNRNKFLIMRKNALKTAKQNNWNLRAKNMLSN